MNVFVFDVDGTLTPSRGTIDLEFKQFFNKFCREKVVWLVTGSDKPKTIEQLGEDTYNLCHTVYNCNGNDVWQSKKHIRTNEWRLPDTAREWLTDHLTNSAFPLRTGLHFEHRPGMCNFSIVGRNANQEQRKKYRKWDMEVEERDYIAHNFNLVFPDLEAKIGGETGIDIAPKGFDKTQILKDLKENSQVHFFGDSMHVGGNDEPLAKSIIDQELGICYNIKNWENTWEILKEYYDS